MPTNAQFAREYIKAIEDGAIGDTLARFFTPDVVIQECPIAFRRTGPLAIWRKLSRELSEDGKCSSGKHIRLLICSIKAIASPWK
jgi:hypothetical protein